MTFEIIETESVCDGPFCKYWRVEKFASFKHANFCIKCLARMIENGECQHGLIYSKCKKEMNN